MTKTNTADTRIQKLIVFGPNLRDQSKGQFVVHAEGCRDCGKLRGESASKVEATSMAAVAAEWYYDQIREGSCSIDTAIDDMHFAPCVTVPRKGETFVIYQRGGYVADYNEDEGGCEWVSKREGATEFLDEAMAKRAAERLELRYASIQGGHA